MPVLVLSAGGGDWSAPWWTWLVVGVVVLMLVTCCTRAVLRAAGVITEDRTVK